MTRDEMIEILMSIKEPLVELTGFCNAVTCEYMTAKGCGAFELFDWNDLAVFDFNVVDEVWNSMEENELKNWVVRYNSRTFEPISIILSNLTVEDESLP